MDRYKWTINICLMSFVLVTLSTNSNVHFRGFFLQARKPNDDEMSYGKFDVSESEDLQTLDCFGQDSVS